MAIFFTVLKAISRRSSKRASEHQIRGSVCFAGRKGGELKKKYGQAAYGFDRHQRTRSSVLCRSILATRPPSFFSVYFGGSLRTALAWNGQARLAVRWIVHLERKSPRALTQEIKKPRAEAARHEYPSGRRARSTRSARSHRHGATVTPPLIRSQTPLVTSSTCRDPDFKSWWAVLQQGREPGDAHWRYPP
ncbi:hypothetical protein ON010_g9364 [Phytophthora cinnamomi]|nr:hypothetical protein ON010_g9364 [Phytophthora cinnamomi]